MDGGDLFVKNLRQVNLLNHHLKKDFKCSFQSFSYHNKISLEKTFGSDRMSKLTPIMTYSFSIQCSVMTIHRLFMNLFMIFINSLFIKKN